MKKTPKTTAAPSDFHIAHIREDGVHLDGEGGLPINHRLRAEALVASGAKKDPGGMISEDFIADTAKRLAAEAGEPAPPADAPITDPPTEQPA